MKNLILQSDVDFTLTVVNPNVDCLDTRLCGEEGTTGLAVDAIGFGLAVVNSYETFVPDALGPELTKRLFKVGAEQLPGQQYEAAEIWFRELAGEVIPKDMPKDHLRDLIKSHFDTVMAQYIPETSNVRMPVARLVQRVSAAQIPIGAVSNSGRPIVEANLALVDRKLEEKLPWESTVTADEVRNSKPAPDMYLKSFYDIVKRHGWSAKETYAFVIEDNEKGAESAMAAKEFIKTRTGRNNIVVCGVPRDYREEQKMAGLCNAIVRDDFAMPENLSARFHKFSGLHL